jgi:hypothetical protein
MALADPRLYGRLGKELAKKPFWVRLLFCWALGLSWIATGVVARTTRVWAVAFALGILFLVIPFVSLARERRRSEPT